MSSILSAIVANKKQEVRDLPTKLHASRRRKRNFINAVIDDGIIAEIKPRSPSKGAIISRKQAGKYVDIYNQSVQAISVLCDTKFFGGGYDLLSDTRKHTNKPILAKEFVIDKKQILQAKRCGADAILLIASILDTAKIKSLARYAVYYGLDVLLEVHDKKDCDKATKVFKKLRSAVTNHIIIGINNRDLNTLTVNLNTTKRLAPYLRKHLPYLRGIICESGISSPKETQMLSKYVDGFLIGTSILTAKDPAKYILSLRPKKTKFCGITRKEDIEKAEKLGVDYLGFIFVPESPRYLTLAEAKKIRKYVKKANVVGVFGDMSIKNIKKYAKELHLDYVQLHGEPSLKKIQQVQKFAIQVFRGVPSRKEAEHYLKFAQFIMIDKASGSSIADFKKIANLPYSLRSKMFIAGGLKPGNVRNAVRLVEPYAVDCASGIEIKHKPRQKSFRSMTLFMHNLQT